MAQWLWVPGAPGSPQNDGWLDLFSYSWSMPKNFTCSVGLDSAYPKLMQLLVNGTTADDVIVYQEPHYEYHFFKAILSSLQSNQQSVFLSFVYESLERYYDGSQI